MPLTTGTRLGPYEILTAVGAGGMGEVYRARDTRLDRDVAIKIVSELFAADPERLARFEREAKTLASLNHPNIAQIHGIEGADIVRALVMEFVDGDDLSERLKRGPIPVSEAIAIARQLADALDAAHERGIVHRDLKPANIKVRDDGTVKVLDFGLSKGTDREPPAADPSQSPTFTSPATQLGVILGTAAYMAPEQAKGKAVDKRADIWAFGVVLFEMLSGRSPFEGETITDVLAHIVTRDPDWSLLPPDTPPNVRHLMERCLQRDPKRRLRDIGDARFELDKPADATRAPVSPAARRAWLVPAIAAGALTLAIGAILGWSLTRDSPTSPEPVRRFGLSGISLVNDAWQGIAVSPDGRHVAYRAFGVDGIDQLFVRALDVVQPRPVPGSAGGRLPFFSPDGTQLAFFGAGYLRRTTLGTGSPQPVVALSGTPLGGTWMDDGSIVFADSVRGLLRVPFDGGAAETLYAMEQGDVVTPWALPGRRGVLLAARADGASRVALFSLGDRSLRILAQDGWSPAWSPATGVLFTQGDSIVRLPFDLETLSATGPAEPIVGGVRSRFSVQSRLFGVAEDGTLAYMPAPNTGPGSWSLVWVDRDGRESPLTDVGVVFDTPRLSPDGRRIVFRKPAPNCDLWSYDVGRGTQTRLTLEGDNHGTVWTADGARVLFTRTHQPPELLSIAAEGGPVQRIAASALLSSLPSRDVFLTSWSERTGDLLVRSASDTFVIPQTGEPRRIGQAVFEDSHAVFSPDGARIAYASDESGRLEVYVQASSAEGRRIQISTDGGTEPVWARNGKQLFFRQGRRVLAVDVTASPSLSFGRPRLLFSGSYTTHPVAANYDVSPDGERFLMVKGPPAIGYDEIVVVSGAFGKR